MRVVLAVAAVVTAGALAGALVLALRPPQAARRGRAAATEGAVVETGFRAALPPGLPLRAP